MKYNDISPIEFLDRVEAVLPHLDSAYRKCEEMRRITTTNTNETTYYVISGGDEKYVGSLTHQFCHGLTTIPGHSCNLYSTISGNNKDNPFFTYISFSDEWCRNNSIYDINGVPIPDVSTVTEDYIFQQSLVLSEVQSYAEILFSHAKKRGTPSFMTSYTSLVFFEELARDH